MESFEKKLRCGLGRERQGRFQDRKSPLSLNLPFSSLGTIQGSQWPGKNSCDSSWLGVISFLPLLLPESQPSLQARLWEALEQA